jgi:hypothetical protein
MIARAPRILALDPSGRGTGVAIGAAREKPLLFTVRFATDELDRGTEDLLQRVVLDAKARPHPTGSRSSRHSSVHNPMIVCGLYAIFVGLPKSHGVKVMPVTISTWRKYFAGRGAKASAEPFGGHPPPGRARAQGEGEITYYVPLRSRYA